MSKSHKSYFFIGNEEIHYSVLQYNRIEKTDICLRIINITPYQLSRVKIRLLDNALINNGDFVIVAENNYGWYAISNSIQISKTFYNKLLLRTMSAFAAIFFIIYHLLYCLKVFFITIFLLSP